MFNLTNISYLNNLLLENIRSTYLTDALNLYLIVPMGVIGSIFNTITILILCKKTFNKMNIYKLMKVYSLASLVLTFGMIFYFLLYSV